jgi:hypothetical protein
LTVSASLKGCYLINIKTLSEKLLTGSDSFTLDGSNDKGYSIRCDISSVGRLSKIKFSFDGKGHVESNSPYHMLGDKAAGSIINAVDYLSTCGRKVVKVQGFLNDDLSFEQIFNINVKKANGASCDTGSPTAPSPVRAPKGIPAPVPVRAPKGIPAPVPVRAPKGIPAPVPVSGSCPARVSGYTLVDAKTSKDIMPLRSYSMSDVPESLSIRADIPECSRKVVESVFIDFDGMTRCEFFTPYAAFGDDSTQDRANSKAKYNGMSISAGRHTIKATPYTTDDCSGKAGRTHILTFTVDGDTDDY